MEHRRRYETLWARVSSIGCLGAITCSSFLSIERQDVNAGMPRACVAIRTTDDITSFGIVAAAGEDLRLYLLVHLSFELCTLLGLTRVQLFWIFLVAQLKCKPEQHDGMQDGGHLHQA